MSAIATVLLVEDEALIREMIAEELREAGLNVIEAEDGDLAADLIATHDDIDLLFTDIKLPGRTDGWEVARQARRRFASLPVVYASGHAISRSAEVPNAIFFNKPYKPSAVVQVIKGLLEGIGR
jgi:two-component system, response regulator PdtaR